MIVSGPRLPLVKVSISAPLMDEPAPHTSAWGNPVATNPGSTIVRSLVKEIPERPTAVSVFVIVKDRVTVSPGVMGSSINDRLSVGSATTATSRVSIAGPLLPLEEVKALVVFTCIPMVVLVTSTWIVQRDPAAMTPSIYTNNPVPSLAVKSPPTQFVDAFAGVASTITSGRLLVKSRSLATRVLALLSMVNVKVLIPPWEMTSGEKVLVKVGGSSMIMFWLIGLPSVMPPEGVFRIKVAVSAFSTTPSFSIVKVTLPVLCPIHDS